MPTKIIKKVESVLEKPIRPKLHKINDVLSTLFYLIWIIIGVFIVLMIIGEIRSGALKSIIGGPAANQQQVSDVQAPTETEIPGIGTVNIDCVKGALSTESISKILEAGNTSGLSDEERTKFEPCVVEAVSPVSSE